MAYVIGLSLAVLALLVALSALWVAAHTWRHAPGRRLWADLQLRIEDLEADNEALHERLHKRARVENVTKATAVRVEKQAATSGLLDEAAAVLASKQQPQQPARAFGSVQSEEAQLAAIRRTFQ